MKQNELCQRERLKHKNTEMPNVTEYHDVGATRGTNELKQFFISMSVK